MYPKIYKSIRTGAIVRFTSLNSGEVLEAGLSDHRVGELHRNFLECTSEYWDECHEFDCRMCENYGLAHICQGCTKSPDLRTDLFKLKV